MEKLITLLRDGFRAWWRSVCTPLDPETNAMFGISGTHAPGEKEPDE